MYREACLLFFLFFQKKIGTAKLRAQLLLDLAEGSVLALELRVRFSKLASTKIFALLVQKYKH